MYCHSRKAERRCCIAEVSPLYLFLIKTLTFFKQNSISVQTNKNILYHFDFAPANAPAKIDNRAKKR
jgi:hypothetical protein